MSTEVVYRRPKMWVEILCRRWKLGFSPYLLNGLSESPNKLRCRCNKIVFATVRPPTPCQKLTTGSFIYSDAKSKSPGLR